MEIFLTLPISKFFHTKGHSFVRRTRKRDEREREKEREIFQKKKSLFVVQFVYLENIMKFIVLASLAVASLAIDDSIFDYSKKTYSVSFLHTYTHTTFSNIYITTSSSSHRSENGNRPLLPRTSRPDFPERFRFLLTFRVPDFSLRNRAAKLPLRLVHVNS